MTGRLFESGSRARSARFRAREGGAIKIYLKHSFSILSPATLTNASVQRTGGLEDDDGFHNAPPHARTNHLRNLWTSSKNPGRIEEKLRHVMRLVGEWGWDDSVKSEAVSN